MDELRSINEKSIGQAKVEFNFKKLLIIIINPRTIMVPGLFLPFDHDLQNDSNLPTKGGSDSYTFHNTV